MDIHKKPELECLTTTQANFYNEQGYLLLENHLDMSVIETLRGEIARIEQTAYGMTESDEKLDLEDSHRPDEPRIRRIKLPHTQSDIVRDLMYSDAILAPIRDLVGANIRLHTTKLNMKSAGYGAPIDWHQDFAFYPHTNDDVLALAVIIDDMRTENGPLKVFAGSHKGPIYDHHVGAVFAGGLSLEDNGLDPDKAVELNGPAGSVSIHHGRIVHGSAENVSDRPRRLLFIEMMAADAFPIMGGMTKFNDIEEYNERMLCGVPTIAPRVSKTPVRIPQPQPAKQGSIYEIQKQLKQAGI